MLPHLDGPAAARPRRSAPEGIGALWRRDQWPGTAILSVDRGQDREVSERGAAPDLPRARRFGYQGDVRQRAFHLAAQRVAAGDAENRRWAGAGRDDSARIRHRVRLLAADATSPDARAERGAGVVSGRAGKRDDGVRGSRWSGSGG